MTSPAEEKLAILKKNDPGVSFLLVKHEKNLPLKGVEKYVRFIYIEKASQYFDLISNNSGGFDPGLGLVKVEFKRGHKDNACNERM